MEGKSKKGQLREQTSKVGAEGAVNSEDLLNDETPENLNKPLELDGVGPVITDPPPTSSTSRSRSQCPQVTDSSQGHDGFLTEP